MTSPLLIRRLYRSLLQSSKPFTAPSRDAAVLSSLLHRTGIFDDEIPSQDAPEQNLRDDDDKLPVSLVRDLSRGYAEIKKDFKSQNQSLQTSDNPSYDPHHELFQRLVREVVSGSSTGSEQMRYPSGVDTTLLQQIIRREFRDGEDSVSKAYHISVRKQVAFSALRAINQKLVWAESMGFKELSEEDDVERQLRNEIQRAKYVSRLPLSPPSSYLQSGCYLVAHPLMTGFFARTVVCLLEHDHGGTYGLIVNRMAFNPSTGREATLREVIHADSLSERLSLAFGDRSMRDGGPVHKSMQMVYTCAPGHEASLDIGGVVLSALEDPIQVTSAAIESDRAVYYRGDVDRAAEAVVDGDMDVDDVSLYVGASCWTAGQLESEIERGVWLPCRGPTDIALTGKCSHGYAVEDGIPKYDLWLSMMCALGEEEATLAHLVFNADFNDEHGGPCDIL